eukprot:gnl/TRDRNA2_/TRDRNA2_164110_c2_seq2.p2 gnl/TRDRNA2_/TRDRNA2_164110_c2~~gnl/TRDRNA2_/TRDRNA2_164110_c2_seq2.p2  ORF type:complete len:114 (-),score=2.23 gnl/TRDRNA2_/TRDRNA2_164110_c2_seq2:22-363(-)
MGWAARCSFGIYSPRHTRCEGSSRSTRPQFDVTCYLDLEYCFGCLFVCPQHMEVVEAATTRKRHPRIVVPRMVSARNTDAGGIPMPLRTGVVTAKTGGTTHIGMGFPMPSRVF